MKLNSSIVIQETCERTVERIRWVLEQANLQVVQSFDLRSTRAIHNGSSCSQHGTKDCDCQWVVLLVYGEEDAPVTVVLDGRNGQVVISIENRPGQTTVSSLTNAVWNEISSISEQAGTQGGSKST